MFFIEELKNAAQNFNFSFNDEQLGQFEHFYNLVIEWNQKINLTAITDPKDFAIKHIIDSISIWNEEIFSDAKTIVDVGTGAGFPGIPLKIYKPYLKVTLIDSLAKRVRFLETIAGKLELENIFPIHSRAEEAAHSPGFRETFDIAVSRAVAKLNVLSEYCLPFVKVGGYFAALKGSTVKAELDEASASIKILGGKFIECVPVKLPNGDSRNLIYVEKISATPNKFPRKAGIPEKKPLL